jgi:hypothetical protein
MTHNDSPLGEIGAGRVIRRVQNTFRDHWTPINESTALFELSEGGSDDTVSAAFPCSAVDWAFEGRTRTAGFHDCSNGTPETMENAIESRRPDRGVTLPNPCCDSGGAIGTQSGCV